VALVLARKLAITEPRCDSNQRAYGKRAARQPALPSKDPKVRPSGIGLFDNKLHFISGIELGIVIRHDHANF
jgi:hypothetical protein